MCRLFNKIRLIQIALTGAIYDNYSPTEVASPLAIEVRTTVDEVLLIMENHNASTSNLVDIDEFI